MKLAIVVNSFPEFSETFIINKVLFLAKNDVDVSVIRLTPNGSSGLMELYNFKNTQNISILDVKFPKSILDLLSLILTKPHLIVKSFSTSKKIFYKNLSKALFLALVEKNNFDIVHFEFSGIATSFIDIIKDINTKTVVSCRGSAEKVKPLTQPERKEKLKQVFNVVDAVHCVSNDMENTIAPYCSNLSKVFVNRPAIDASFFTPNKIERNESSLNILTIGRFTFQKGYLIGLLAIKRLVEKGLDIKWNIIGDGELYEEIVFHIHTLQLQNHVFLLGKKNKNEVNEWMNRSDVFLLTSVYEGIPNVVLEAMAMELAVVTTNCGGVDEVIEHGKDGFITELYDSKKIAEYLEHLFLNREEIYKVGKEGRKKILAEFTLQRQVNVFKNEYHKIINILK